MTKIKLFGEIGRKYGQDHCFKLDRLSEFGSAMEANHRGFRNFFIRSVQSGKSYNVFVDGKLVENKFALESKLALVPKEIVILPIVGGALYVIPTIASFVAEYAVTLGASYAVAQAAATVVSLVLYAVVSTVVASIFAPKPKSSLQASTANAGLNSYYFGGRENRAQQGVPIPIVYGLLKVGSYVIQAGIRNLDKDDFEDLDEGTDGTTVPTGTFV